MTTLDEIRSANWQLSTSGLGNVVEGPDDINQALALVLMSVKGSDPFRPTFGSDIWEHADKPLNVAGPLIVRAITDAVGTWEQRVKIKSVNYTFQKQDVEPEGMKSGLVFVIAWEAVGGTGNDEIALTFTPSASSVPFTVSVLSTETGEAVTTESGQLIIL